MAAATQNQTLSALLFLYKEVLAQPLPWLDELERAKRPARLPAVLTRDEAQRLLGKMHGAKWLMASLLYGAGLRLRECLKLRVKDVDFGYRTSCPPILGQERYGATVCTRTSSSGA